jgi:hypothetical protein
MAVLTVQQASIAGAVVTLAAAAAGGDSFPNDGRTVFHVKTSGTISTVTFNRTKPCSQGFDHDPAVAMAATEERIIGPFPVEQFGPSVGVTYSSVTGVTVAARSTP